MSQATLPIRRIGYVLAGVCALAVFLAASNAAGRAVMDWKLKLAPAAAVAGERVMLGEISQPVGHIDPETWRILAATPLWPFPGREGQLTLTRTKVLEDLDRLFPGARENFAVPDQIVLKKGGGQPVMASQVDRMIVDFLTENLTGQDGEIEVKELSLPAQLFIDNDLEKLSVESAGPLAPGRVSLRLTVTSLEGKALRQMSASAFVNLWKVVPVAAKPLNMKEGAITPEKVTWERRNLALVKGTPWDPKDPTPLRVKASLNQGTPLTSETLEPMPAIQKGEQVTCLWRGSTIQLSMPVTALTDGAKGAQISVRNVQSGRELAAVVLDSKTVAAR